MKLKSFQLLICIFFLTYLLTTFFDPNRYLRSFFDPFLLLLGIVGVIYSFIKRNDPNFVSPRMIKIFYGIFFVIVCFCVANTIYLNPSYSLRIADTSYIGWLAWLSPFVLININKKLADKLIHFFCFYSTALSVFMVMLFFVWLWRIDDAPRYVLDVFRESGSLYTRERYFGNFTTPYLNWISSPILIIGIGIGIQKIYRFSNFSKHLAILVALFALFLSGTRANMIASVILLFVYCLKMSKLLGSTLVVLASISLMGYAQDLMKMFSPTEQNNSTKLGYLPGYLQIWSDRHFLYLGQGFSQGGMASSPLPLKTELTLLEIIRVFGVPAGLLMIAVFVVFLPYYFIKKRLYYFTAGYFIYILVASTNPYLFSKLGASFLGISFIMLISESHETQSSMS